jgi:hypothetical protein
MELTQEYFDKGISNVLEKVTNLEKVIATKNDLAKLKAEIITKQDLKQQLESQTSELKQYVTESFQTQQVWMDSRFEELIEKYDVRERVHKLEKDVAKLKLERV